MTRALCLSPPFLPERTLRQHDGNWSETLPRKGAATTQRLSGCAGYQRQPDVRCSAPDGCAGFLWPELAYASPSERFSCANHGYRRSAYVVRQTAPDLLVEQERTPHKQIGPNGRNIFAAANAAPLMQGTAPGRNAQPLIKSLPQRRKAPFFLKASTDLYALRVTSPLQTSKATRRPLNFAPSLPQRSHPTLTPTSLSAPRRRDKRRRPALKAARERGTEYREAGG